MSPLRFLFFDAKGRLQRFWDFFVYPVKDSHSRGIKSMLDLRSAGFFDMASAVFHFLMAFLLVGSLAPSQMVGCGWACKCASCLATQNGVAKSDCNTNGCCFGELSCCLGCGGVASCSCAIPTAVSIVDVTQRSNFATGQNVDGSSVAVRVIRSLVLLYTPCVQSRRKCSWQAFACVWIK